MIDGTILFGTAHGLMVLSTERELLNPRKDTSVKTVITNIEVNGTPSILCKKDNTVTLTAMQANFLIEYTSLDYSPFAHPDYQYKLEGFDTDWISAFSRNTVQYTNLKPGNYVFRVKNQEYSYTNNMDEGIIYFTVKKPLFLRWYFILLYFLLIALLIYGFVKFKSLIYTRRRMSELEKNTYVLKKNNEELEYLSHTDALTGLNNRHGLAKYMKHIKTLASSDTQYLACLMIDIDFFKTFNDKFGHVAGDDLLKLVANTLNNSLASNTSSLFRYGGEEFLVFLSNCKMQEAFSVAERLRVAVSEATQAKNHTTISIGVYSNKFDKQSNITEFIYFADEALYEAKHKGRDTVCIH